MGNVASLELCKELYELSGWETGKSWDLRVPAAGHEPDRYTPKYDLGYTLRKLPTPTRITKTIDGYTARTLTFNEMTNVPRLNKAGRAQLEFRADTPEDAACKLAIELFKQGILTKEAP